MIRAYWFIRDQPRNFEYVHKLEARLRLESLARNRRIWQVRMPDAGSYRSASFPLDRRPTGFESFAEEKAAGELNYDVPPIKEVCALDLVGEAFSELRERSDLKEQFERVSAVVNRLGY